MNKNTIKTIWKVVTVVCGAVHTGSQLYSSRQHQKEFEDLKKVVAELQKKG